MLNTDECANEPPASTRKFPSNLYVKYYYTRNV